jgi:LysR family hydrogen peroxide-inducible transcriptional activator
MKPFGKLRGPIEDDKPHLQAAAGGARSSATAAPWRTAAMRPASRETFVLAAPRAHLLGRRAGPAEIRELGGADVLLLDDGHCLRDQALAVCAQARTHELDFRATSLSTLTQMVGAGAGVTLLPRLAVAAESRHAALAIRPLADARAFRTLGLCWRRTSPLGPVLRQIAAIVRPIATAEVGAARRSR